MIKNITYLFCVLFSAFTVWGQGGHSALRFTENLGQFNEVVRYKVEINDGEIFLEDSSITYNLYSRDLISDIYHGLKPNTTPIKGHAYRVHVLNALPDVKITTEGKSNDYKNYYLGNNPNNWVSGAHDFSSICYKNIYDEIDLKYYGFYGQVKYDFIVKPNANPQQIVLEYEGMEQMQIKNGHLFMESGYGTLVEQSPYAYQEIGGKKIKIDCKYILQGNKLSFQLGEYDSTKQLTIDPVLSFATYTGSTASNFGCTATYDLQGNMYVGGTVFGFGYPTTIGAFQTTFSGGNIDMGITKFSSDGTTLLYSTYIGGSDNEIPHSLVVNDNNQLYILGTGGSSDYPTLVASYDNIYNGGPPLSLGYGYGFQYANGCDIVVTKFNPTGTALMGSTFIGGTGNDGINRNSELHYNYGDAFRGEIIVDNAGDIYVASTTASTDFPVVSAPQTTYGGGGLDACLFKLDNNLSNLLWSTYLGGSDYDCAYSIQPDANGDVFATGGTKSSDFPTTAGALHTSYQGGVSDGFVVKYTPVGNLAASSFIGTNEYDQCFFVQSDNNNDIFLVGQTTGTYPISLNTYNNPNSGQFLHKLDNTLSTTLMTTTLGTGSGEVDIAISAFMVSECNQIYISGWGGFTNTLTQLGALATHSTTTGLPITSPTFQSTTDDNDFYLMVLNQDAQNLLYATYFGGSLSHEHVDGGTSRFDKSGKVYQAVCAGCGGHSDFPTTPGAWSNTNNSSNCNLGAFKFDLANITPTISIPQPFVCLPSSYTFNNNSTGGNAYHWDFGDGTTSTDFEPAHTFADTGHYQIELIVMDTTGCLDPDTAFLEIDVFMLNNAMVTQTDTICPRASIQLSASGGVTYQWSPPDYLDNPNISHPTASPPVTTTYQVVTTDSCGADTAQITIHVYDDAVNAMPDTTICLGTSVQLMAYGGTNYSWVSSPDMANPTSQTPTVTPTSDAYYFVDITTIHGCIIRDSVQVTIVPDVPTPVLSNDTTICIGDTIQLYAQGGDSIHWYPSTDLSSANSYTPDAFPEQNTTIYANFYNVCGFSTDSVAIEIIDAFPEMPNDTIICPGTSVTLQATGADTYLWTPSQFVDNPTSATVVASPDETTIFHVATTNICGQGEGQITVQVYDENIDIIPDSTVCIGMSIQLWSTGGVQYTWQPTTGMTGENTATPSVTPNSTTDYIVNITTSNGCLLKDTTTVTVITTIPQPVLPNDTLICAGDTIQLTVSGGAYILWSPDSVLSSVSSYTPLAYPTQSITLNVDFINACGTVKDSMRIDVTDVYPTIVNDTSICPHDTALLWVSNADYYQWTPPATLSNPDSNITMAMPESNTTYTVECKNTVGCTKYLEVTVSIYDLPYVYAGADKNVYFGVPVNLNGVAYTDSVWWYSDGVDLSCYNCLTPEFTPELSSNFVLMAVDTNGCENYDTVTYYVNGALYIPNAFSPNGDGYNDYFVTKGAEITDFTLQIFDRWGQLLFETHDLNTCWDGKYRGNIVQQDAYIWKVKYSDHFEKNRKLIGHVNVIR